MAVTTPNYSVHTYPAPPERIRGMFASTRPMNYRYCMIEGYVTDALLTVGTVTAVIQDTNGKNQFVQASTANNKVVGVSVLEFSKILEYDATNEVYQYPENSLPAIITQGDIIMQAETAVNVGDPVFYRVTADTAPLDVLGLVAPAAGAGLVELPGARFLGNLDDAGLVVVGLNLPG